MEEAELEDVLQQIVSLLNVQTPLTHCNSTGCYAGSVIFMVIALNLWETLISTETYAGIQIIFIYSYFYAFLGCYHWDGFTSGGLKPPKYAHAKTYW